MRLQKGKRMPAPNAWRAGAAKVDITPPFPTYMMGYGNRTRKHRSVLMPIYARALALESKSSNNATLAAETCVIMSVELLGVSNEMVEQVQNTLLQEHGVAPAAVRITATHTHSGPSVTKCVDDRSCLQRAPPLPH